MRRITVIFMTKQDSVYMVQIEVKANESPYFIVEQEIFKQCPNLKDVLYIFDGWPNRIT